MNNHSNSFSFKDQQKRQQFLQQFAPFNIKKNQNYHFYFKKENQIVINVHKKKLHLQGKQKDIESWLKQYNVYFFVEFSIISKKIPQWSKGEDTFYVGFDEAGLSDFFGPIILSSFFVNEESIKILKKLNVCDSKKLSQAQIYNIGSQLITFKEFVSYQIITVQIFNNLYKKKYHQKQLLAYFYGKMGLYWLQKHRDINLFFDQFVTKKSWKNYQKNLNISYPRPLHLFPNGEQKYLGIAAASIVARFLFLQEIEKITKIFNTKILLGSSKEAQNQVTYFLKKFSREKMKNYVKNYLSFLD